MKMSPSNFYCTICGAKGIPIIRTNNKNRELGHLKKIYCLNCGKETNHAECKDFSNYTYHEFLIEYKNHNFTDNGLRRQPWRQFVASIKE